MKLISFLCCEVAIQDVLSSSMSLINILEEINAVAFPIAVPRLTAFAFFEKEEAEAEVQSARLRVTLNDQQFLDLEVTVNFQGKRKSRVIAALQGFPLMGPGKLKVSIHAGDPLTEKGSWVVGVVGIGAPKVDLFSAGSAGPASATNT
jgi:hypothetical protein